MTAPLRNKSLWYTSEHKLGRRRERDATLGIRQYDDNVRYVLEDIAIQLNRIADALEGKKNG